MTAAPSTGVARGLAGRHLVLGMTGGVACYKSAELCRELVRRGATVQVVMTESAERFVGAATMQAVSGRAVYTSQWDARRPNAMPHIDLTRGADDGLAAADAIVVAPTSADFLARLANGHAGELLSLLCIARPVERCRLYVCPAMNREMWSNPATRRNVARLEADGVVVLGPAAGDQACGEVGDGRMLEPMDIADALARALAAGDGRDDGLLRGRSVLVTAGPTFEPIDPVRGLTNRSSGKMGFAIADAAVRAGARVTLVAGPVHLETPQGVERVDVGTALEMHAAVLPRAAACDVFVATAAVADWRVAEVSSAKIKKGAKRTVPALQLVENPDILAEVAALPRPPYCVGFAAESENLAAHAREKLVRKKLPLVVANIGSRTFGRDDNAVTLVDAEGDRAWPPMDKRELARRLVAEIAQRLAARARSGA